MVLMLGGCGPKLTSEFLVDIPSGWIIPDSASEYYDMSLDDAYPLFSGDPSIDFIKNSTKVFFFAYENDPETVDWRDNAYVLCYSKKLKDGSVSALDTFLDHSTLTLEVDGVRMRGITEKDQQEKVVYLGKRGNLILLLQYAYSNRTQRESIDLMVQSIKFGNSV